MDWDRLLRDFLRDDRLEPLVKDIGTMLGCPLLVVDIAFHIMGSYVPDGFQDEVFEAALTRGEITYEVASALNGERLPDPADGICLEVVIWEANLPERSTPSAAISSISR